MEAISVRPMRARDFAFIRGLASRQPNFTVPPAYVLWALATLSPTLCLVATGQRSRRLGYLLTVPGAPGEHSVLVWQLASVKSATRDSPVRHLLRAYVREIRRGGIRTVYFTAVPTSAGTRRILALVRLHMGVRAQQALSIGVDPVPTSEEVLYRCAVPQRKSIG